MTNAGRIHTITLIPGDGIGPEVTNAVVSIIDAAGVQVSVGAARCGYVWALEQHGTPLPDAAARLGPPQSRRAERTGRDADRRGLHQRQRRGCERR